MVMEKSLFIGFFGNYPLIRVLDFLVENNVFDYSKKEICNEAKVSWNTLETFWQSLVESETLIVTRKVGKAEMYKLNSSHAGVKKLFEIDKALMKSSMGKLDQKKQVVGVIV